MVLDKWECAFERQCEWHSFFWLSA